MNNTMTNTEIREWLNTKKAIRTSKTTNEYWWGRRMNINHSDGSRYEVITIFSQMDDKELNWEGYFGKMVTKYLINGKIVNITAA